MTAPSLPDALPAGRCRWHQLPGDAQVALVDALTEPTPAGVLAHTPLSTPPEALWLALVAVGALTVSTPEAFPVHLARFAGDAITWSLVHTALTWLGLTLTLIGFSGILRTLRLDRHVPLPMGQWLLARGVLTWDGRWLSVMPIPAAQPRVVPGHGPNGTRRPELRWGETRFLLPAGLSAPPLVRNLGTRRREEDGGEPSPVPWNAVSISIHRANLPVTGTRTRAERGLLRAALPIALMLTPPLCPDEVRTLLTAAVEGPAMARETGAGARLQLRAEGLSRLDSVPGPHAAFLVAATAPGATTLIAVEAPTLADADVEALAQEVADSLIAQFGSLPSDLRVRRRTPGAPVEDGPSIQVRASATEVDAALQVFDGERLRRVSLPLSAARVSVAAPAPTAPDPRGSATRP